MQRELQDIGQVLQSGDLMYSAQYKASSLHAGGAAALRPAPFRMVQAACVMESTGGQCKTSCDSA